jgi:hypothetical protein
MKRIPVSLLKDELARRRINEVIDAIEDTQQQMTASVQALNALIETVQGAVNGKQPLITPAAPIASLSTDVNITLVTQVAGNLNTTNTRVNTMLSALRSAGIVSS